MNSEPAKLPDRFFDPTRDVFIAQSNRPAGIPDISLDILTPFQRALLVIDGTVTSFIEAYRMERVKIEKLGQEFRMMHEGHQWLELPAGGRVLERRVMLTGTDSGCLYADAKSLIVFERLPVDMQEGLDNEPRGLGRILLDSDVETRREGLWYGRETIGDLPAAVAGLHDGEFLSRTYRIITGHLPLMAITERFPC